MKIDPSAERLYQIKNDDRYFHTGHCSDGRQVLMGLRIPYLVAVFFGSDGTLIGTEERILTHSPKRMAHGGYDLERLAGS